MTVTLANEGKPTNAQGEKSLVSHLAQTIEGRRKEDPPTKNKLQVGIHVTDVLAELEMAKDSTEVVKSVGDCTVIVFYYFLRVGEYTVKGQRNERNQKVQFNS